MNNMPKWPAYIMGLAAAACAVPGITSATPAMQTYRAIGQEPGWALIISGGRMAYAGDYGDTRLTVAQPAPTPTANGLRYAMPQMTVDIDYSRCNDAMSGHGYENKVSVTVAGRTVEGCGGARRAEWDV